MVPCTLDIWKKKLDWVAEQGGMALVNTHPDYMHFDSGKPGREEYPVAFYEQLLEYINARYEGRYWHVLPRDLSCYWLQDVVRKQVKQGTDQHV